MAALKMIAVKLEGTGTNRFNPSGEARRAEAVTVLMKMLALKGK
ncbi:hypothetical protein [Paenibacillus alginolyticus]|nr:hypothetical protein [Paenibacillus alginolyticus]MEC0143044.1 hypothetical protein [Paenibacillus alginolyticus]